MLRRAQWPRFGPPCPEVPGGCTRAGQAPKNDPEPVDTREAEAGQDTGAAPGHETESRTRGGFITGPTARGTLRRTPLSAG